MKVNGILGPAPPDMITGYFYVARSLGTRYPACGPGAALRWVGTEGRRDTEVGGGRL